MARDRQRAKQRRARRAKHGGGPELTQPRQENVPAALQHASADVDEFDAKLVAEAEGVTAEDAVVEAAAGDGVVHPEALSEAEFEELEDAIDDVEEAFETGDPAEVSEAEEDLRQEIAERRERRPKAAPAPGAPTKRGPPRFIGFLRASWAELQRVQWPDRRQVGQATAVVLGFVIVAGVYLGIADALAKKLVDLII